MSRRWACDSCRKRKIQCDRTSLRTACDWCEHHNLACTFNRPRRGKSAILTRHQINQSSSTSTSSDNRVHSLPINPPNTLAAGLDARAPLNSYRSFGHAYYEGRYFGHINPEGGVARFSEEGQQWISSKTGEITSWQTPQALTTKDIPTNVPRKSPTGVTALPFQNTTRLVLGAYLNSTFKFPFPFIDAVLFQDTITWAYRNPDGSGSLDNSGARCCVLAFLSLTGLFTTTTTVEFADVDINACANEARYLLADVLENPNITCLQSVLMLQQYETFLGRLPSAITLSGVACRIVMMLGGHVNLPSSAHQHAELGQEERERRLLRTLFWMCYLFDNEIALRASQPTFITEDYCDLTLPESSGIPYPRDNDHGELFSYLHGDICISHLKGKVNRLLYSVQASRKQDAELLRDIRELDAEVEEWRLGLPADVRPFLYTSQASTDALHETLLPHRMRVILINLEYFHLLVAIHHASGRCKMSNSKNDGFQESCNSSLDSSLSLCLEACRAMIVYLRATVSYLAVETFWVIQFYPMVAITTLFLHILNHPLDSRACGDLRLLDSAAEIFLLLPVHQYMPRMVDQAQMLRTFVVELARLARCAVYRSKTVSD